MNLSSIAAFHNAVIETQVSLLTQIIGLLHYVPVGSHGPESSLVQPTLALVGKSSTSIISVMSDICAFVRRREASCEKYIDMRCKRTLNVFPIPVQKLGWTTCHND